jgi:hypothetical protein
VCGAGSNFEYQGEDWANQLEFWNEQAQMEYLAAMEEEWRPMPSPARKRGVGEGVIAEFGLPRLPYPGRCRGAGG